MTDRRTPTRITAMVFAVLATCAVARAQPVDPAFDPGANGAVFRIVVLADGRIMVAGEFEMLGGGGTGTNGRDGLGRLHADGSFDPSFGNVDGSPGGPTRLLPLADGKILIAGPFVALNDGSGSTAHYSIARLNADGSIDESFDPGVDDFVGAMAEQADGKILLGGPFTRLGGGGWAATGSTRNRIGRLNADGSLDDSFDPGANNGVNCLLIQPDGKILVAGIFTTIGGGGTGTTTRNRIARLDADGSLDMTFDPGANGEIHALALQPDGKIVLVGDFTMLGGGTGTTARSRIGRINADGSLDTSFNPGANSYVMTVALQGDGKILVGGYFTTLGGGGTGTTPRNYLGRLNSDGSLDETFNPGANSIVETVVVQTDGLVLVGGHFTKLGGGTGTTTRNRIGRLVLAPQVGAPVVTTNPADQTVPAGATATFTAAAISIPGPTVRWQMKPLGGAFADIDGATATAYSVTAAAADSGREFRAVFTNSFGSATTNAATLRVGILPVITVQPVDQSVVAGATATFTAAASGDPAPVMSWQINRGYVWAYIAGANAETYTFTAPLESNGSQFRAEFRNRAGTVTSNVATLTVNPPSVPPTVTANPVDRIVKAGRTATFTASATGGLVVRWELSTDGGTTWEVVIGATATTLAVSTTTADSGNRYRAVFTNSHGSATTTAATLTVRSVSGSDFDGDGTTDIAVYRRTTGYWYVKNRLAIQYGGPGDIPVAGDYNGDGTTDIAVYRPATGVWYGGNQFRVQFGDPGDIPVPGDYNGDGMTDVAVYRPSTGFWYVKSLLAIQHGDPGDIPVPGDYNGDGTTDIGVYRPSTGFWYVRGQIWAGFGGPGTDIPVPGDYNADGVTDPAVYRPATGSWYVRNQFTVAHGAPGDLPVARDFDGNGTADLAVYRPSTGQWFVRDQFTLQFGDAMDVPVPPGPPPLTAVNGDYDGDRVTNLAVYTAATGLWRVRDGLTATFGDPSDTPVPADYNGDGSMDVAVYRPSTGMWDVRDQFTVEFGEASDIPVPGDYDGDRLADVAVYRPSTGFWYVHNQPGVHFGDTGDIPVPGDYNGDGATEIAVYRPSTGYWYVRSQMAVQLGAPGMTPVPGDYNGDGLTDVAVFDTATATWHIRGYPAIVFGDPTDTPVPGDYDGDGTTDIAVYRPSTGEWIVRNQFTIVFGDPGDVPVVRRGGMQ